MKKLLAFISSAFFACAALAQEAEIPTNPGTVVTRNIVSNGPLTLNTVGTTTVGGQYNGTQTGNGYLPSASGDHIFKINGYKNLRITDNYINFNSIYSGPVNGNIVISGAGGATAATSGDVFGGMISVESPFYPNFTPTGVSLLIGSLGPAGEIHFIGNGALGHVTIDSAQGTNPNGNDQYTAPNNLRFAGSQPGSGKDPYILVNAGTGSGDGSRGLLLYNSTTGGFRFLSSNTFSSLFEAQEGSTADVNGIEVISAPTSSNPQLTVNAFNGFSSPDANVGINLLPRGNGAINTAGHMGSLPGPTSAPGTPTSCGTGTPSVVGTDMRGTITTGTAATTCTLPFGTAYASAPYCVVSDNSLVGFASVTSTSTSNMILGISAALTGGKITYICIQ